MTHKRPEPKARRRRGTADNSITTAGFSLTPPAALLPAWEFPDPESPRGRIHAAARKLFAEKGLEATSVRDITESAGVNSAMVHYYYRSKEELYRRVLGLEILSVFSAAQRDIPSNLTAEQLVVSLPARIARLVRANPVWASLFRQEMALGAPHLERVARELGASGPFGVKTQIETLYREAVQRGELRDLPVNQVIQFLVILGYSGTFFEPFFRIMTGTDPTDEGAFEERIKIFEMLIRNALIHEKTKARKP